MTDCGLKVQSVKETVCFQIVEKWIAWYGKSIILNITFEVDFDK